MNKNGLIDVGETDPNKAADDVKAGCTTDADCGDARSGRVCDTSAGACIDGCHSPGNGCGEGFACTSSDSKIGVCDGFAASGSGLLCAAPARPANGDDHAWMIPLALAALLTARRRRR